MRCVLSFHSLGNGPVLEDASRDFDIYASILESVPDSLESGVGGIIDPHAHTCRSLDPEVVVRRTDIAAARTAD